MVRFLTLAALLSLPVATSAQEVQQGGAAPAHPRPVAPPAAAVSTSGGDLPKADDPRLIAALRLLDAKQPQQALDLVTPMLAAFDRGYASEKRRIYCAVTPAQALAYMADAATAKQSAVAVEQGWCRAQYVRAFALVDLQRLDEAGEGYRRLVGYAPFNPRYLNELGYVLQQQRKLQESLDTYRRSEAAAGMAPAADIDTERCTALHGIGYDLIELGKLDEATAAYRKCLAIRPGDKRSTDELDYIAEQRKKTI